MKDILALVLFCLPLVITGCGRMQNGGELPSTSEGFVSATPTHDFSYEDSRAACQAVAECVLMRVGGCENVQAIHLSQVELAQVYTERAKLEYPDVVCAPDFPIEEYEALCLNQKCRAVLQNYRLIIEVPAQPVAGKPFWVGMSFRFHVAAEEVTARFVLPEHLVVVRGQTLWSGSVEAFEDHVMWVEVVSEKPGKVYLSGWADIQQGNTSIPPLTWSEYFSVILDATDTLPSIGMPVLATPTHKP